jgi:hypothetical protein
MNFVFTSAGDNTNFDKLWLDNNQKYDVYVIYYGDNNSVYERYRTNKHIKFIERRKGSKFQNFLYFYKKYFNIIQNYERFFILDDDIIFNVDDINKMFEMSKKYNLDICGPSFVRPSKISWKVTIHKPERILTYTNFVEVNTMLFNKMALNKFMKYLSDELIGWGIDALAIWANGLSERNKYAIIHSVKCINPHDKTKKVEKRELYKIKDAKKRRSIYEKYIKKIGIYNELKTYTPIAYKSIVKKNNNIYYLNDTEFTGKTNLPLVFK